MTQYAFPGKETIPHETFGVPIDSFHPGMTLRQKYADSALQGFTREILMTKEECVRRCFDLADAMIEYEKNEAIPENIKAVIEGMARAAKTMNKEKE